MSIAELLHTVVLTAAKLIGRRRPRGGQTRKPRIFVDVSVIYQQDSKTGIQRVVRSVWLELLQLIPQHYEVIAVAATRACTYRSVPSDFLHQSLRPPLKDLPKISACQPGDIFFGLDLSAHIVPRRAFDILRWRRQGARLFFVVYDLLPELHPEWFSNKLARNFSSWLRFVGRHSHGLMCISETVANNLRAWLIRHKSCDRAPSIRSFRLGGDIAASLPSTGLTSEEGALLNEPFSGVLLLCVGTIEPRKGHALLVEAFEALTCDGIDLRLAVLGRPGWKTDEVQDRMRHLTECNPNFAWFPDSSDEFLAHLYGRANLVIVPSYDEGFGLPILEALQHGCHVLVRDIPVFRELDSPGVHYFSGQSPMQLASRIAELLEAGFPPFQLSPHLVASWRDCVTQVVNNLELE